MKIHYLVIAIVLISAIMLGMISFITSMGEGYSRTADLGGFNNTKARLDNQNTISQNLSNTINDMQLQLSAVDLLALPYTMVKTAWYSAKSMFNSWFTINTMLTEGEQQFRSQTGIPLDGWVLSSILGILILTVVAIIVYAFFKWYFTD